MLGRSLCLLVLIGCCLSRGPFAPAEDTAAGALSGWGAATNPQQDARIALQGEKLQFTLPATVHDLSVEIGRMNAPRVLQSADGDFTLSVKVANVTHPRARSVIRGRRPFIGAGLLIWADEKNYIRLERASLLDGTQARLYASWELRQGGQFARAGNTNECALRGDATWLRITRQGDRFLGAVSDNGRDWTELSAIQASWPAKLQVGVAAVNDTTVPFRPQFSDLSLQ